MQHKLYNFSLNPQTTVRKISQNKDKTRISLSDFQ